MGFYEVYLPFSGCHVILLQACDVDSSGEFELSGGADVDTIMISARKRVFGDGGAI
jgi:hypothetical protein